MLHKALQTGPANASYMVINPRFSRDHDFFPKRQADQEPYPYPVPTFWGYGGEHQPGRLPNGFQIYLLFAKKGSSVAYGWQEAYTYGVATDSTWRSGQCVGLALNPSKGQVIHWVEIW